MQRFTKEVGLANCHPEAFMVDMRQKQSGKYMLGREREIQTMNCRRLLSMKKE